MKTARLAAALPALLLLSACTSTVLVPIAGGDRAEVTFGGSGPEKAEKDGFRVDRAGIEINVQAKAINYVFDLAVADGRAPRSIRVEDVSDNDPLVLAEDDQPALSAKHWHFVSPSKTSADQDLGWLLNIEQSMRIYRFTVEAADGSKTVLYQAAPYSGVLKTGIRKALGLDY